MNSVYVTGLVTITLWLNKLVKHDGLVGSSKVLPNNYMVLYPNTQSVLKDVSEIPGKHRHQY